MSRSEPIIVEQHLRAPLAEVWRAITDPDQMRQWFFAAIDQFAPQRDFETRFNVRSGDRDYPHLWKVTDIVPTTKLVYDWKYEGFAGESVVVWELAASDDGTKLTLTHTGSETFPQDDAAFQRENCQAGWRHFLCVRLKAFVEAR